MENRITELIHQACQKQIILVIYKCLNADFIKDISIELLYSVLETASFDRAEFSFLICCTLTQYL